MRSNYNNELDEVKKIRLPADIEKKSHYIKI